MRVPGLFIVALTTSLAGPARAGPASAPHAASCVAALQAQATAMAALLKPGDRAGPQLLQVVRNGITIVGTQYLAGLREADARQLLQAAEQEFASLPASLAERRQKECMREGQSLYDHVSALERSLISRAAERRIKHMREG